MLRPSLSWLDISNYTWRRVQVMKLLIMQFPPTSYHFIPLWSKYSRLEFLCIYAVWKVSIRRTWWWPDGAETCSAIKIRF
jgi:hypothetical protein